MSASTALAAPGAVPVRRPERCCAALCDYRPEVVESYLRMIVAARRRGLDLTAELAGARGGESLGRAPGVSTSIDLRTLRLIWDIERVMAEGALTVEAICRRLCVWSLEDETRLPPKGRGGGIAMILGGRLISRAGRVDPE